MAPEQFFMFAKSTICFPWL